ncbi:cellulose-binding protein [Colletotrichum truncatum]|uniref:Cellulose-binding protein n=1 Tax=Colletotrichum truncatum TaxID=5467 RepID=A0ACC3YI60_COLTU|nr:cellulose-binding protein [Colletotrichum truncatum]KAF6786132.1 cellulose-binding protein [Colletotrichum truncatum]
MPQQDSLRFCNTRTRVFILTDITNEPDDSESLVRYLLYSNEFDTRGLVACTSTHMRSRVSPEEIESIVEGYAKVVGNLNAHTHPANQYPSAQALRALIKSGPAVYGKLALEVPLSEGSELLINTVDESEEPLWVLCWGGANPLAQAVDHVDKTRDAADSARFRSKLRVYAISDQDDTGAWLRIRYSDIFYICSVHGWSQYNCAAWTGISGPTDPGGADPSLFTKEWLKRHIQIGPLGETYPDFKFLVEGDTPTFLYLIQNGLGSSEHPHWGSWGGRYTYYDPSESGKHFADAVDSVVGVDGRVHTSNFATIWRWRQAFQNDFAARMQWTLTDRTAAVNHAPVVFVNESTGGPEPLLLECEADEKLILDASKSYDPDGDTIYFHWFQYREPTGVAGLLREMIPDLEITYLDPEASGRRVELKMPPPEVCCLDHMSGNPLEKGQVYHFVLEVSDSGTPSLTTYKRIVIQTTNRELLGGRPNSVDTNAEWLLLRR